MSGLPERRFALRAMTYALQMPPSFRFAIPAKDYKYK